MTSVRVSDKGLVTLPAAIRRQLGIAPGTMLSVEIVDNTIVLKPIKRLMDLAGTLPVADQGKTTDWDTIRAETRKALANDIMNEGLSEHD
jgi:AbrB family looped-hinge helix DNA binding protein